MIQYKIVMKFIQMQMQLQMQEMQNVFYLNLAGLPKVGRWRGVSNVAVSIPQLDCYWNLNWTEEI